MKELEKCIKIIIKSFKILQSLLFMSSIEIVFFMLILLNFRIVDMDEETSVKKNRRSSDLISDLPDSLLGQILSDLSEGIGLHNPFNAMMDKPLVTSPCSGFRFPRFPRGRG